MHQLKKKLEEEIAELRKARDLGEEYRAKVDELNMTNQRLVAENRRAEEIMADKAMQDGEINAARASLLSAEKVRRGGEGGGGGG